MGITEDGLIAVEELIFEIVQKAGDVVYKHHLQRRVVPYAVQRSKAEMLSVVEWLFLQHDNGDIPPHDEPAPCSIDSWARGALESTVTTHQNPQTPLKLPDTQELKQMFLNTNQSTYTQNQKSSHDKPAHAGQRSTAKPKPALQAHESTAMPVQASTSPARTQKSNVNKNNNNNTNNNNNNNNNNSRESKEVKQKPTTSTVTKGQSHHTKEDETEKLAKFKREIRGREYFYDHSGNVVIVNQTDYDKVPNTNKVNVKVTIVASNTSDASAPSTANATSKPSSPQRHNTKFRKKQEPSSGMTHVTSNKFYKEIKLSQPSMMDATVKVAPGVTLHPVEKRKEGSSTLNQPRPFRKKEGPPPTMPPHTVQPPQPQLQTQTQQQPQVQTQVQPQVQQQHTLHPRPEPILPAIPVHHPPLQPTTTLTLSPTTLYGSTQKLWTTEMLSEGFNSLLPSIKPRSFG